MGYCIQRCGRAAEKIVSQFIGYPTVRKASGKRYPSETEQIHEKDIGQAIDR